MMSRWGWPANEADNAEADFAGKADKAEADDADKAIVADAANKANVTNELDEADVAVDDDKSNESDNHADEAYVTNRAN